MRFWLLSFLAVCFPFSAAALPNQSGFFESEYKFKPNCNLCHVRVKGGALNDYGEAFASHGSSRAAFTALEGVDIDKDSFFGEEEIKARSNPGDAQSTPKKLRDWLENLFVPKPPRVLYDAFPEAEKFLILERALTPEEKEAWTRRTGEIRREEADDFIFLFVARSDKGLLGASGYVALTESSSLGREFHSFLISVNPNGKLVRLDPVHVRRKPLRQLPFLKQFRGLWPEDFNKVKFPPGTPKKLAEDLLRRLAVMARTVDVVLPP